MKDAYVFIAIAGAIALLTVVAAVSGRWWWPVFFGTGENPGAGLAVFGLLWASLGAIGVLLTVAAFWGFEALLKKREDRTFVNAAATTAAAVVAIVVVGFLVRLLHS